MPVFRWSLLTFSVRLLLHVSALPAMAGESPYGSSAIISIMTTTPARWSAIRRTRVSGPAHALDAGYGPNSARMNLVCEHVA